MMATAFASPQIATFLSSTFPTRSSSSSYSYISLRTTSTLPSLPSLFPIIITSKKSILFHSPPQRKPRFWPISAATAEDAAVDASEQLISNTDDGASIVVSALFFVAFIGLSVITIGVIYLAVVDFLQKREKEKFEKEEAAKSGKKKKKKKNNVARIRAGPRGFGQKIDVNEDDDD